jgi:RHS repeat-associated protein
LKRLNSTYASNVKASNLTGHTDGKSQTISYVYDTAGKLTNVNYPTGSGAGTGISYTYDNASRQTGMTDVTGTTGFVYDNADRLTSIAAPNGTTGYGYDNANRRTSMTAGGVTGSWTYGYDSANRLLTTLNPYAETATNGYDIANRLTSTTNGNGSVTSYAYDAASRTTGVLHQTSGSVTLAQYGYTYDAANNVLTRTDTDGTVTTFGYDASDQLTSEVRDNSHSTGYSLSYTYDHNHNRTGKTQAGVTTPYAYDAHDKLTSAGSKTYGYDLNGNCTSVTVGSSVTGLTYDVENRVVGITYPGGATNSFAYNGEDLRTRKVDSAGTKNFLTDGASPASAVLSDGAAVYTPGLSERRGTASKFYHADALGSTRGITDSTQATTDAQLYDAFGMTVSRTGTTPTPFGFVGKEQYQTDSDSGLQLLGHRYYDPSIGRFLSSDPAHQGSNWYVYCGNNPLTRIDPNGKWFFLLVIVLIIHEICASQPGDEGPRTLPPSEHPPTGRLVEAVMAHKLAAIEDGGGGAPPTGGDPPGGRSGPIDRGGSHPTMPTTPGEMAGTFGGPGTSIPDGPTTPGRGKIRWTLPSNAEITYEQHPYHPGAPPWHSGPHYHYDIPGGVTHARVMPGDPIPPDLLPHLP